jgi:hypothetical protein
MAVAFGSIATATVNSTGTATSLTITKPTGLAAGDYMVAIFGYSGNTNPWALTGWTSVLNPNDTSARVLNILVKVASASDASASDFTFTISSGAEPNNVCGALLRITGNLFSGTANVVASDNDVSGAASPSYTGGVTPGAANTLLIMGAVAGNSVSGVTTGSYAVTNDNPSWTERADFTETGGAEDILLAIATATYSVGTTTGNYSLAFSADPGDSIGFLLSINESTNVTVTPDVITMTSAVQAPTLTGSASVSPSVITMTSSVQAPTTATAAAEWTNTDKSSSSWTNPDKT